MHAMLKKLILRDVTITMKLIQVLMPTQVPPMVAVAVVVQIITEQNLLVMVAMAMSASLT